MVDMELLIISVEKHPCIWNTQIDEYQKRELKELAWEDVCRAVYKNWDTTEDKPYKCAELKKKWYNIRDYYKKGRKGHNNPTASASKRQKKYIYADMLAFLESVYTRLDSEEIYHEFTDGDEKSTLDEQSAEYSEVQEDEYRQQLLQVNLQESQERMRGDDAVSGDIYNILKKYKKLSDEEDSDAKFLMSFVSDMKKMNHKQKIDFKVGVTLLLQKTFEEHF